MVNGPSKEFAFNLSKCLVQRSYGNDARLVGFGTCGEQLEF